MMAPNQMRKWWTGLRNKGFRAVCTREHGNNKQGLKCKHLTTSSANTQIGKCCCEGNIMEEVLTLFLRNQYKWMPF